MSFGECWTDTLLTLRSSLCPTNAGSDELLIYTISNLKIRISYGHKKLPSFTWTIEIRSKRYCLLFPWTKFVTYIITSCTITTNLGFSGILALHCWSSIVFMLFMRIVGRGYYWYTKLMQGGSVIGELTLCLVINAVWRWNLLNYLNA